MSKEFKQKLKEFEGRKFRYSHFSRALAKQAERYIDFAQKMNDKEMGGAETKKLIKKTEYSELGKLLKRAKTNDGLTAYENALLGTFAKTQDRTDFLRALEYKELNICLQALSETKNEAKALMAINDLFEFIGENCNQSLDGDYIKRVMSTATMLLEADGKKIERIPKQEVSDEWE